MIRLEIERNLKKISYEEKGYISKRQKKKESLIARTIGKKIPDKLEDTLNSAFVKAFEVIFKDGSKYLDVAVDKNGKASYSDALETVLTTVEGAGMGALGIGIPDIPVYTAVVLRSVFQIAEDKGFEHETKTEKVYVLKLIAAALSGGEEIESLSEDIDSYADSVDKEDYVFYGLMSEHINAAGKALAEDMLYMKFIQGIPVVGAAGGISNAVTLNKIRQFAEIKYEKRKLKKML